MFEAALAAASQIFTPPFRKVLWKTLALTLALLTFVWIALHKLIVAGAALPYPWAEALSLVSGVGLFAGLAFLIIPVSFIAAGFFFDELAEAVEQELASGAATGRTLPLGNSLWLSVKFSALALVVNFAALLLLLVPGVNVAAFFGANAYLSGRGYFELAASRYLPFAEIRQLRRMNALRLFGSGLVISALLAVPVFNLLTPLFATAFMVRVTRNIMRSARGMPRSALS
ncbi:MAG: EI24 domain-containing protein [Beijerinckiaceae bacterium]|nr:EI24 domain-containing protein [Beijerinckiaceae bacterium]